MIDVVITFPDGVHLSDCLGLPPDEESIKEAVQMVRRSHVEVPPANKAALGVYVCAHDLEKPKSFRFFRFMGDLTIEEEVANDLWVRNVMFSNIKPLES